MQKISSYLYPNRIELLANLAGFYVEYTNVYKRNIKIYSGVDNTLEFDIKSADQKRVDLTTLTNIVLNVMDVGGKALPSSPYTVTPVPSMKGIASVTIPADDLSLLSTQYLSYSLTATQGTKQVLLYADTRFGGSGTLELAGNVAPVIRPDRVYDTFVGEIDLLGNVINRSSAIPAKFYEAIPTEAMSFKVKVTGFVGEIWLEATTNSTISVNSFTNAAKLRTFTATDLSPATTTVSFSNVTVGKYENFRVLFQNTAGTVESVTVEA